MNILLLEENEISLPANDYRVRHVRKVLKLGVGDRLRAGIVNGAVGTAIIDALDKSGMSLSFQPDETSPADGPAGPSNPPGLPHLLPVDLLLGHPRPIVLRRMLRDLCTIGIRRLIVTPTELGERSYLGATMWHDVRPLLVEGAAQAGVTRLMQVVRCHSLIQGIQTACGPNQRRVVLHPTPHQTVGAALRTVSAEDIVLAVGSERGWTVGEVDVLTRAGFEIAGMGERTLRTETAALVVSWMARAALAQSHS